MLYRFRAVLKTFLICVNFVLIVAQLAKSESKTLCSTIICNGSNGELRLRISDLENTCSWAIKNEKFIFVGHSVHSVWDHITVELSFISNGIQKKNIYDRFFNSTFPVKQINVTLHKGKHFDSQSLRGAILAFNYCPSHSTPNYVSTRLHFITKSPTIKMEMSASEAVNHNDQINSKLYTPFVESQSTLHVNANHEKCTQYCKEIVQWKFEDLKSGKQDNEIQVGEVLIIEQMSSKNTLVNLKCQCERIFQLDHEVEKLEILAPDQSTRQIILTSQDEDISKEKDWNIKLLPGRKLLINLFDATLSRIFQFTLLASQMFCGQKQSLLGQTMTLQTATCQNSSLTRLQIGCVIVYSCQDGYLPQTATLNESYECTNIGMKHLSSLANVDSLTCRSGCIINNKSHVWRNLTGTLLSPDFPNSFERLSNCEYDIVPSSKHQIYLYFIQFNVSSFQMQIFDHVNNGAKIINVTQNLLVQWQNVYKSNGYRLTLRLVPRKKNSHMIDIKKNIFHLNYTTESLTCTLSLPAPSLTASGRLFVTNITSPDLTQSRSMVYTIGTKLIYNCLHDKAFSILFWLNETSASFQQESGSSICTLNQDSAKWMPSLPGCLRPCGGEFEVTVGSPRLLVLPDEQAAKCTWQFRTLSPAHTIRLSRLANNAPVDLIVSNLSYPQIILKKTDCQTKRGGASASPKDYFKTIENNTECLLNPKVFNFKSSVSVTLKLAQLSKENTNRTTLIQMEVLPSCDLSQVSNDSEVVIQNNLFVNYVELGSVVNFTCRQKGLRIAEQSRSAKCVINENITSEVTFHPPGQRKCDLYCPNEVTEQVFIEAEQLKPFLFYIFFATSTVKTCVWTMKVENQLYWINISLILRNSSQSLLLQFEYSSTEHKQNQREISIDSDKKAFLEIPAAQVRTKLEIKFESGNEHIEFTFCAVKPRFTTAPLTRPSLIDMQTEPTIPEKIIDETKKNIIFLLACCGTGVLLLTGLIIVAVKNKPLCRSSPSFFCKRKWKRDIFSTYMFANHTIGRSSMHSIDLTQSNPAQTETSTALQDTATMLDVRGKILNMLHPETLPLKRLCGEWPNKIRAGSGTPASIRSNHICALSSLNLDESDSISCSSLPHHQNEPEILDQITSQIYM